MTSNATRLGRAWPTVSLLAIAGFVAASLCAHWNPSLAQDAEKKQKKGNDVVTPAKAGKKKVELPPVHSLTAGKQIDAAALSKLINSEIAKRLTSEKVKAAPLADDAEFIRRVYLDLVGVVPPADKVAAFLDSKDPQKRAKVIDELLADPRFGNFLAENWTNLMVPRDSNNRVLAVAPLKKWLAAGFNEGKPLNKMVAELITATGTQEENGAATYFVANNSVDKITDNVTRMFLGVQLQCAQCHNHPFTDYKQNEYWAMAAFFMKTRVTATPQQAAKKGTSPGVVETPKAAPNKKKGGLPESAKIVPAKFLRGEEPKIGGNDVARPHLAKWLTDDKNPYFARAMANRFWHQLFGRGIVNPVDDMHDDNYPVMPELLATITEQVKLNGYDAKYIVRAICNSEAYQRSSRSGKGEEIDPDLYSHRAIRVLSPEQLFDSLTVILGNTARVETKNVAQKKGPQSPRDNFISFFRVEEASPLDYNNGIPQMLRLMNSAQTNRPDAAVAEAMKAGKEPAQVIERLYLTAYARRPTAEELERLIAFANRQPANQRQAYGDIMWALVNSSEFMMNH